MFIVDYDRSQRKTTSQGFLQVPGRLARSGIQSYYAFELGMTDGDRMRRIRVYRPESEVFDKDAMASFEDNPITVEHPDEAVTVDNWKQLAVGHVRNIRREGIYLVGDMTITDRTAIKALDDGKVEISNGYAANYVFESGVTPDGEAYDVKQTKPRGNHVAMVDAARCGSACRVSDSINPSGANKMPLKKTVIDGLPLEFDESAVVVIEKLVGDRDTVKKQLATAQENLSKAVVSAVVDGKSMTVVDLADALVAANKLIAELRKDVLTPDMRDAMVADWSKMIADTKRIAPKVETKGKTCAAIRREVVTALNVGDSKAIIDATLGGSAPDKATDEQIKTAFNVLAAAAPKGQTVAKDAVEQALNKEGKANDKSEELDGRDAYLQRGANAWQTPSK